MEQLTKIKNKTISLNGLKNKNGAITFEGENDIKINNKESESFTNNLKITLEKNSFLKLLIFDVNTAQSIENNIVFDVCENAKLNIIVVSLNTKKTMNHLTINLNEKNSAANVTVISVAADNVDSTFNVICNNNAPHTDANIVQKAVALNGGKNVFEATGYIGKDCSLASNFQESRVLLLDGASKGDASPILLINHHDVKAGHAAGVSRVNDDDMYYLMSRGINRVEAERLMTIGFIRPLLNTIDDERVRENIFETITKKVNNE